MSLPQLKYKVKMIGEQCRISPPLAQSGQPKQYHNTSKRMIQPPREICKKQVGLSPSLLATTPPPQTQERKTTLTKTQEGMGWLAQQAPKMLANEGVQAPFYRFWDRITLASCIRGANPLFGRGWARECERIIKDLILDQGKESLAPAFDWLKIPQPASNWFKLTAP